MGEVNISGGCLCGAVRYEGAAEPMIAGQCYCTDCRRASGTGHGAHLAVPDAAISVTGDLTFFDKPADSGSMVSRGFCPTCGSAVYSTNSGMPGAMFIRASSLDDPEVFQPMVAVYTSRAPSWDKVPDGIPGFDEMPPAEAMP